MLRSTVEWHKQAGPSSLQHQLLGRTLYPPASMSTPHVDPTSCTAGENVLSVVLNHDTNHSPSPLSIKLTSLSFLTHDLRTSLYGL